MERKIKNHLSNQVVPVIEPQSHYHTEILFPAPAIQTIDPSPLLFLQKDQKTAKLIKYP